MRLRVLELPQFKHRHRLVPAGVNPFLTSLFPHITQWVVLLISGTVNGAGVRRSLFRGVFMRLDQDSLHTFCPITPHQSLDCLGSLWLRMGSSKIVHIRKGNSSDDCH